MSGTDKVERARAYARTEQWDKALKALGEAIALEPDDASAYETRAYVYERLERWDQAIADRSRRIELSPEDAWPESRDGSRMQKPDLARAHRRRSFAYAGSGDLVRAVRDLDRSIALDAKCAEAWDDRGVCWTKRNDLGRALADFDKAIELDSSYRPAILHRAQAHATAGRSAEAARDFRRALALDPLDEALAPYGPPPEPEDEAEWLDRGFAYAAYGRHAEAIDAFERVHGDAELETAALVGRARARLASNDVEAAIADLDAYLERSPDAFGHLQRGNAHLAFGRCPEAISDFTCAIELSPALAEALHGRGRAYARLGDWPRALLDFDAALLLDPLVAEAWIDRARVREQLGNAAAAGEDRAEALDLDPRLASSVSSG